MKISGDTGTESMKPRVYVPLMVKRGPKAIYQEKHSLFSNRF